MEILIVYLMEFHWYNKMVFKDRLIMDLYLECYSVQMLDLKMVLDTDIQLKYFFGLKFDLRMGLNIELYWDCYSELNMGSNTNFYLIFLLGLMLRLNMEPKMGS